MKLNAARRLLAFASVAVAGEALAEPHVRFHKAQHILEEMQKLRIPVTFNPIDYTIGFRFDSNRMWKILERMGFSQVIDYKDPDHAHSWAFRRGDDMIRLVEPREGWDPIIQILH